MNELHRVDRAALDRLLEWGGDKLLTQMLRLFLENATERMNQIDTGLGSDDLDPVERGSHSLKSSAANVGAKEVSRLAAEMESAAEEGDWERIRTLRTELGDALDAARIELQSVLEGRSE